MERRPNCSEKEDHHNGKMDMESMYRATERLVTVSVVLSSRVIAGRAAGWEMDVRDGNRELQDCCTDIV